MNGTSSGGPVRPTTTSTVRSAKGSGRPLVMVTAYDVTSARLAEAAGVDMVLVGDSLGMVVLGHDSTLPVTMDDMVRHTAAASRGVTNALLIADMPFLSYQVSIEDALRNAGRLMVEGGAKAVKVEGASPSTLLVVEELVEAGIPVVGHVGLTPQSVHQLGGYSVQAREAEAARTLIDDCCALQDAGAFAIVLECIPAELAERVTRELDIVTIGIGAGAACDGQVQVLHDILGLGASLPRHAKRYVELGETIRAAIAAYADDVRDGGFPGDGQCTRIDPHVLETLDAEAAAEKAEAAAATEAAPDTEARWPATAVQATLSGQEEE